LAVPESELRPRIRVAALIVVEGRVVLTRHLKEGRRYHLLPGGGVAYRETLEHALVREVAEETGLAVRVGRPVLLSDTIDPEGDRHSVNIVFIAEPVGGSITTRPQDPRVEGVDLVSPSDLASLEFHPPIADAVLDVLRDPQAATARYLGSLFTR
jgi:8-oxo-dGTP diphosphatase